MNTAPTGNRPSNWLEKADLDKIHYMSAIRTAKSLALEFRHPDLMAVVLAVPTGPLNEHSPNFVYTAALVPTSQVFNPYPGEARVLHVVGVGFNGEPKLLPESYRRDVVQLLREMSTLRV